ncbi:MAG: trypsin-like peptidase domain-containing protein [Bacteroidetes bacterium]|mgnify:CR=1 FL=1|nr:trypsin-like peptidase domain-containing protein [Bacteroidota bacterium]HOV99166.1 trypsin-like peptidase domain-containing protein [Bacteroidota bacterium]
MKTLINNPYTRIALILAIPLFIGFGIGYAIKPPSPSQAEKIEKAADYIQQVGNQTNDDNQEISASRRNAITYAAAKVSPCVVGINVIAVKEIRLRDPFSQFFDDPFFQYFFGDRTYRQEVKGLGSGFIISSDGYIVTNDHVAGDATDITVTLVGGKQMKARLVGTDPASDICLLKVDGKDLPYISFGNSDDIIIGEWAIALGNPFGLFEINSKPTVTVGVISSTGMKLGQVENRFYRDMIETDAAINGGNSGGPLINANGEVIGMNTLIYTGGQTTTYIGYGFAIPSNKIKRITEELKRKGKVSRNITAGFDWQPVDARIARYLGMDKVQGIIVNDIVPGGPADKAGLRIGDVVLKANGESISSGNDILAMMVDMNPGDVLNLTVYRERKTFTIKLVLEKAE